MLFEPALLAEALTTLAIPDPLARRETVAFFRAEFDRNRHLLDLVRL